MKISVAEVENPHSQTERSLPFWPSNSVISRARSSRARESQGSFGLCSRSKPG